MATKMELSLDDIIKTDPGMERRGGGGRGGPRGGRGGRRGGPGRSTFRRNSFGSGGGGGRRDGGRYSGGAGVRFRSERDDLWAHDKYQGRGFGARVGVAVASGGGGSHKITVSNLHFGVSDADIVELFGEVGQIKYASVHYDRSGRSMGKADVVFERKSDAQLAINQYNGVPLDGRPMMITYANAAPVTVVETHPVTLRQVEDGRVHRYPRGALRRGGGAYGGVRRGRGGGRGGGSRGVKAPTAAELDAELDAYVSANAK